MAWLMPGRRSQGSATPTYTAFEMSWTTTSPAESITLPLRSGYSYNALVDWGDSSSSTITAFDDADRIHEYTSSGTYTVSITGTFECIHFNNNGDTKIKAITQWGNRPWAAVDGAFYGCSALTITASDSPNLTAVTSMGLMLAVTGLTTENLNAWDTSGITDMNSVFYNCSTANPTVTNWDTSAVTTFAAMFSTCPLANPNVASWNTALAQSMVSMFFNSDNANPNVSSWVTTALTTTVTMFRNNSGANPDVSSWDTSALTLITRMFDGATIANPDLSSWDVTGITDATEFADLNTGWSDANYSAALVNFDSQAVQTGVAFHAGTAQYTAGAAATARANLIADHSWSITDGGAA